MIELKTLINKIEIYLMQTSRELLPYREILLIRNYAKNLLASQRWLVVSAIIPQQAIFGKLVEKLIFKFNGSVSMCKYGTIFMFWKKYL